MFRNARKTNRNKSLFQNTVSGTVALRFSIGFTCPAITVGRERGILLCSTFVLIGFTCPDFRANLFCPRGAAPSWFPYVQQYRVEVEVRVLYSVD